MDERTGPRQGNGNQGNSGAKNQISAPSISLPKGGGAIRGMGEKFAANPVTGTGSMTVPIAVSPGRSGFAPQLSLSYDSGAGNGPFGFGWSISLPSITRKTDKGLPKYQDAEESDVFILSAAEDLVPTLVQDGAGQWVREVVPPRTVNGRVYRVQRYRPRIEGLFARIERWTSQSDPEDTFWRSISRDNITTFYGKTAESRIADPGDRSRVFQWLVCESYDDKGNAIVYEYQEENSDGIDLSQAHEKNRTTEGRKANRYLKRVKYGNQTPNRDAGWNATDPAQLGDWMFEVVFDYGEGYYVEDAPDAEGRIFARAQIDPPAGLHWPVRQEPFSTYRAGFEVRTYRLCQRAVILHHFPGELGTPDYLVRSTEFTYNSSPIASFITQVTQSGYVRQLDGAYLKKSLPPLSLEYSKAVINDEIQTVDTESLQNLPTGADGLQYQWLDLDGEGLQGVLSEQEDGWYYKRNLSPISVIKENGKEKVVARFDPLVQVSAHPSIAEGMSPRHQFLDLAGDGQLDVVQFQTPVSGFFERTHDERWDSFVPFESVPNLPWNDPNVKFLDLTGDGHADILITENDALTWYPSLAEEGFGTAIRIPKPRDEEDGPAVVFADGTQAIFVADISGDGLTDIVRIRNGEVCYWPNLGYGRFGAKVTMDNAPWFDAPDQFDQKRIRLADIDGSGMTDIIYLERNRVTIYRNECGNGWSPAEYLTSFPAVDDLSSVTAVDLLGNGTACLVWSSPLPSNARRPMRYIDLMGGQKPHLLIKTVNNLGAETHVQYAPSTKFYLADKLAGKPWITRLPFPVHVVERVETYDRISRNRFVTRYAYHHGYFDGVEREFRGFGLVEQWDTEEYAALSESGALPTGDNVDKSSHVPPVVTKTWFHTGAYLGRDRVSNFFAGLLDAEDTGEYYREPGLTDEQARKLLLDDTVLPPGLTIEEEREACRALKGSMLRQEVYALDGTAKEKHPYTVTEQNFGIRRLQPKAGNRHAVLFTHALESTSYHYERNPADPRIAHALTLEVDEFGNVLKSAAVGYGRRQADPSLPLQADRDKQAKTLITYTENRVTNPIDDVAVAPDDYRTPLPCETRTFELTGYTPTGAAGRFQSADFVQAAGNGLTHVFDSEIDYEGLSTNGRQRRRIEHVRTLYRKNNLTDLLPLGTVESLALPGESYKLAFTRGLVADVYGGRVSDAMLETEGRYVHSEGDADWWIPSGRVFFSPGSADTAAQELAHARQHFFLPHRFRDPFHTSAVSTESFVSYAYDLLIAETRDALGNRVTVGERDAAGNIDPNKPGNDYRVLQPRLVTDPNRNRTEVAFDTLGMVAGTAVKGKDDTVGDTLAGFEADLTQSQLDQFYDVADPHVPAPNLLQGATTRIIYDLERFRRTRKAHPEDPTQWLPVYAATLARETHVSDPLPPQGLKIQIGFSYSDGFGREIQKKIQAEPGPLVGGGPVVSPRWVGSGWTIFNNKGKPVRQYEPFFDDTHNFKFGNQVGVSTILFYDPVERVVATLHPNHTYEKVVFDPWQQKTWDVNDTVLIADPKTDVNVGDFFRRLPDAEYLPGWYQERISRSPEDPERQAADKAMVHASTPAVAYADSLGRTFLTVAHNRFERDGSIIEEKYPTRVVFDIEGNQRKVIDAKDRIVMSYDYDMLGNRIHQASMDAGERWVLSDVIGKPIRTWDDRKFQRRITYDGLRRPAGLFVSQNGAPEFLAEKTEYGESKPDPEATNHRGKVWKVHDGAGIVTNEEHDFKGNLLCSTRQLLQDYETQVDWDQDPKRESEIFTSRTIYDALNRPVQLIAPHSDQAGTKLNVIRPGYNEANLLERIDVWLQQTNNPTMLLDPQTANVHAVTDIDYNEKGRRKLIEYDNGVKTEYKYDEATFRLINLKTIRSTDNANLQDLSYTYDPVGNITEIRDEAQLTIYFHNTVVEPHTKYVYDAIYRLIKADGREHIGQVGQPETTWNDEFRANLPHPHNGLAMRNYTEQYEYDAVGNFEKLIHQATNGDWTRAYSYNEPSLIEPTKKNNRLSSTTVGMTTETYPHDAHGNMTKMPHLAQMQWDFEDQLHEVNLAGGGKAYYVYDAAGQRVRKVIEKNNGTLIEERIYLGGFEIFRQRTNGSLMVERETLHIMDDKQRIALVETRTKGNDGSPSQLFRFQHGNHLGSASLELDETGQIISYEEYYAYGSTSYQAVRKDIEVPLKRYRYTAKERDEESGLYYHGARYYAPWLGRWISCDPVPSANPFVAMANNPIVFHDLDGRQPSCAGQPGCELGIFDEYTIQAEYRKAHNLGMTDLIRLEDLQPLLDQKMEDNYRKYQEKGPSWIDQANTWLNEKVNSIFDYVWNTKPGQKVSEVDESLRETAGNVGAEVFANSFGDIQATQKMKFGPDTSFYTTPSDQGRGVGVAFYEAGKEVTIPAVVGAAKRGAGGKIVSNKQKLALAEQAAMAARIFNSNFSEVPQFNRIWAKAAAGLPSTTKGFDRARGRFWTAVNEGADEDAKFVRQILELNAFELQSGTNAPLLKMQGWDPRITRELQDRILTIEHRDPKSRVPSRILDPKNLRFMTGRDNSFRGNRYTYDDRPYVR